MSKIYTSRISVAPRRRAVATVQSFPAIRLQVKQRGSLLIVGILFWLIFYLNMPDNLEGFAANGPIETANYVARNIKVGMILISLCVIGMRVALAGRLLSRLNLGMTLVLILALLSSLWSIDSSATLLRFVSLISVALVCFAAALADRGRAFQRLVIPPVMFILIGSLAVGFAFPDKIAEIGTDISQKNAWHGITHGKNEFGMVASFGAIVCVNSFLARRRVAWSVIGAAIAITCLVLSRSNTSQFATAAGILSMVLVMRIPIIRNRFTVPVVIGIASTILLYELATQNVIPGASTLFAPILSLTGKDATFSARTLIWNVIKQHIQGAPYLGTGYGAYWIPFPTSPSYVFVSMMFFYPMEAHNGYLETVNDLGFVGLFGLLMFIVLFIRQALRLIPIDRSQAALYLGLLFQEMVINMSESDWFSRTNTFSILLLAAMCLSRALVVDGPKDRAPFG